MRFGLYARLSKDRNGTRKAVERQLEDCRELVERLGGVVTHVFVDNDTSAFTGAPRPEYQRLKLALENGDIDAAASWKFDRLNRKVTESFEYWKLFETTLRPTYTVLSGQITDASASTFEQYMNSGVRGEGEVRVMCERVQRAKLQSARAGKFGGGNRPFGFTNDGMSIVPEEAAVLHQMADRLLNGDSYRTIALALNDQGITTTKGRPWRALKISQTLFRKRNFGIREHLGHEYPAAWPAIFDAEMAAKLYVAQAGRSALRNSRGKGRTHLLKGFLYCGKCGNGLTVYSCQQRNGSMIPAVACRTRDDVKGPIGCGGVKRNLPPIDHLITEAVLYRLDSDAMSALLSRNGDKNVSKYLAEQQAQQVRLDEIQGLYGAGDIDFREYQGMKLAATAELERLTKLVDRAAVGSPLARVGPRNIRGAWETHGIEWKRQVLNLLIEKIEVLPQIDRSKHAPMYAGRWKFRTDLIRVTWRY